MRLGVLAAASIVAAGVLTGCTEDGPTGGEPELGPIPTVRTVKDIAFPLDAYDLTLEQRQTVTFASLILTEQCAARYAVTYPVTPPPYDQPTHEELRGRRFGIFILDQAQRYGYGLPPDHRPEERRDAWNPSRHELLVIVGHANSATAGLELPVDDHGVRLDEDGCSGWAARRLLEGAPVVDDIAILNEVNSSVVDSERDSRVVAAFTAWSDCMAGKGFPYDSPWEANNRDWPEPPTDEEIATAVADVECKQAVNLVGIWLAVETAYQNRAIDQHAEQLALVKQSIDTQLRNATAVIEGRQ